MRVSEITTLNPEHRNIVNQFQAHPPTDLKGIANALGLEIFGATLPPGISGEIRPKQNGDGYLIRVDRHEPKGRQRFTVAHEIAHFLLHRDYIGNGITDDFLYRSALSSTREVQANRLAADILMPKETFNHNWVQLGGVATEENLERMADLFGVSVAAIRIRLGLD